MGMNVRENISMSVLPSVVKNHFLNRQLEEELADKVIKQFSIKTPTSGKVVKELSGGNQQKVILGRWISTNPKILILDEPTKGIDVGAKAEIYQTVHDLAKAGIGVIFISSELTEVINVCENIVVMYEGRITAQLNREKDHVAEETVLSAAMDHLNK